MKKLTVHPVKFTKDGKTTFGIIEYGDVSEKTMIYEIFDNNTDPDKLMGKVTAVGDKEIKIISAREFNKAFPENSIRLATFGFFALQQAKVN